MSSPQAKPQAVSHMLLFFVIPCVVFLGWAGWRLFDALLSPKPQDVFTKLVEVREAKSSGDRWQAAYGLSQSLQKMIRDGEYDRLADDKKSEVFTGLEGLLKLHGSDARLKKYVLLTMGQMGDARGLEALVGGWRDPDPETRFYALWGAFELFKKNPATRRPEHLEEIAAFLSDKDPATRKIAASYLVTEPGYRDRVKALLADEDHEVRWNTAVALAAVGDPAAKPVLREFFDLEQLRSLGVKTSKDLSGLVATGVEAAKQLGDAEILALAEGLRSQVSEKTPEGRAILKGLSSLGR